MTLFQAIRLVLKQWILPGEDQTVLHAAASQLFSGTKTCVTTERSRLCNDLVGSRAKFCGAGPRRAYKVGPFAVWKLRDPGACQDSLSRPFSLAMAPRNRRWKQLNVAREFLKRNRDKPSEVGSDDDALDVLSVSGDEQDSKLIDRVDKNNLCNERREQDHT